MSKSLGNITAPQAVCDQYGADILRLWVVGTDYTEDQRIGPEILKHQAEAYRRLRNTLRYLLGSLDGYSAAEKVAYADMPELERWVLHRLAELDAVMRQAVDDFDFHTIATELHNFCAVDLSAFYFDIRKDAIYCDAPEGAAPARRAHGDGGAVLLPHRVARADHLLHRRGGVAGAAPGRAGRRGGERASAALSRDPVGRGSMPRWARSGRRCGRCAASSPARWSSSAPRSASARACRPRPHVHVAQGIRRGDEGPRPRRDLHHLGRRAGRGRRRPRATSSLPTCPASASCPAAGRRQQMCTLLAGARRRSASRPGIR